MHIRPLVWSSFLLAITCFGLWLLTAFDKPAAVAAPHWIHQARQRPAVSRPCTLQLPDYLKTVPEQTKPPKQAPGRASVVQENPPPPSEQPTDSMEAGISSLGTAEEKVVLMTWPMER